MQGQTKHELFPGGTNGSVSPRDFVIFVTSGNPMVRLKMLLRWETEGLLAPKVFTKRFLPMWSAHGTDLNKKAGIDHITICKALRSSGYASWSADVPKPTEPIKLHRGTQAGYLYGISWTPQIRYADYSAIFHKRDRSCEGVRLTATFNPGEIMAAIQLRDHPAAGEPPIEYLVDTSGWDTTPPLVEVDPVVL